MQPRVLRSICALALLAALAAYAWRGAYTRYVTDDYCSAARLRNLGFAEAMQWHWTQWSGRYSYYAIKAIPESIGPTTARVIPALLIALFCACAVWALRHVTGDAVVCGLAVVFATIDATPDVLSPFGALFWETGALTYMLPLVLYTLWLGLFFVPRSTIAGVLLMLMAGGLSETSLAAQLALTAGMLLVTFVLRARAKMKLAVASFLATILSAIVFASAPGNAKRLSGLAAQPPLDAFVETFRLAFRYIGSNVFVEGAALIVILAAGLLLGRSRTELKTLLLLALTAFGAFVASIAPSAWVLSGSPPPRALHVTTFFFALLLLALAAVFGRCKWGLTPFTPAVLLVVSIAIAGMSIVRVTRTFDEARRHAAEADRIDAVLRANRGRDVVLRAPLALAERLVFADPSHWTNRCICDYHGVRSLTVTR